MSCFYFRTTPPYTDERQSRQVASIPARFYKRGTCSAPHAQIGPDRVCLPKIVPLVDPLRQCILVCPVNAEKTCTFCARPGWRGDIAVAVAEFLHVSAHYHGLRIEQLPAMWGTDSLSEESRLQSVR
jgi:hypothetical protein